MTSAADRSALDDLSAPLLVVRCGNGRMLWSAIDAGIPAIGIDTDVAAIAACVGQGLPVLRRRLSDPLPREGAWASILLVEGAVRAGDDVEAVLDRCADLLAPGGLLVVEASAAPDRDAHDAIPMLLRAAGAFDLDRLWESEGRWFVRLRRP